MLSILRRLLSDENAATVIEYSLIVLLITMVTIAAMTTVGQKVMNMLAPVANAFG